MIDAQDRKPVERDVFHERLECRALRLERPVEIHVFTIDVGHDRNRRGKFDERAVGLVRLDDHPLPVAEASVCTVGVYDPAVDHGWVVIGGIEKRRDEGCRGRLAVGAADCDRPLQPHELGEHFSAADDGHQSFAGRHDFGVVRLDRG